MATFMKAFAPTNKSLGHLSLLIPSRSSLCSKFCILLRRILHSKALCYGVSKWKLFICQSICELCRTNQDNPMMIGVFRNEMTLMTTLLVWELMVTSDGLVSCVIGLDERFRPLMISINTNVFFSIKTNLYCHTNSLSIKHVDALESRSV